MPHQARYRALPSGEWSSPTSIVLGEPFTGLSPGPKRFAVRGINALGPGPWSNAVDGSLPFGTLDDVGGHLAQLAATGLTYAGPLALGGNSVGDWEYVVLDGPVTLDQTAADALFSMTADSISSHILVRGDLTIPNGVTLRPPVRKLFLALYVTGKLTVDGVLSMSRRGANHSTTGSNLPAVDLPIIAGTHDGVTNPKVPAAGASGAPGKLAAGAGNAGSTGTAGATGGGGSGATAGTFASGAGAAGTAYSGGPGGAGCRTATSAQVGAADGGAGGSATGDVTTTGGTGAGAGNPGGAGVGGSGWDVLNTGNNGTGGPLAVFCDELAGSGSIESHGAQGGGANTASSTAGAGSGGGSVTIVRRTDTSTITPTSTGGPGGLGGASPVRNGGPGGNGTARKLLRAA